MAFTPGLRPGVLCRFVSPVGIHRTSASRGGGSGGFADGGGAVSPFDSNAWTIEHRCTQCGAPINLGETDRLFACPFCRVKMCLTTTDCFRYYLPAPDTATPGIFYAPYWRIKGMSFSCDGDYEVRESLLDATHRASNDLFIPESLGLRPQTLKLRFIAPGTGANFVKPSMAFDAAFSEIQAALPPYTRADQSAGPFYSTFVGEKVSLVYAPFYIRGSMVFDAILGEPLHTTRFAEDFSPPQETADGTLKVLPALCPNCGADLEGGRESIGFFCTNCNSSWYLTGSSLERIPFSVIAGVDDDPLNLPFWRIKARFQGITLETFADLVRMANLPRAIKKEWESQALFFWVPAFKVNAGLLLRISRLVTINQSPQGMAETDTPPAAPYPITFPVHEAAESIKVTIAALMATKKKLWPILKDLTIFPVESRLVYIPFRRQGRDLINMSMQFSVSSNSLKHGEHL
ncbi:MAG: hypothetical protein A4E65_02560 [Syntrophorhabdus sp. PtaU1.Bin153]|nr:MAG: hypothetical protein A4E65_02560 [Syntrophorhabdus sp. PtaU1.Bin153]